MATFNIRNGFGHDGWNMWWLRRATTARAIAALQADVVALQEVHGFQQRYLERRLPGYRFIAAGRSQRGRGERCPILVADGPEIAARQTWWYGDTPEVPGTRLDGANFPRIATTASLVFADPDGGPSRPVEVVSTHLDEASGANRLASATQLADAVSDRDRPWIVMGDFNADADSEVIEALEAAGLRLVEPAGRVGTEHRFTGDTDGRRIDHILVSHHFTPADARVVTTRLGRRLPSDHWPVTAILDLE